MTNKLRNWTQYNKNLVKRGTIIFNFSEDFLSSLYYSGINHHGGVVKYSPIMYEYMLTIKVMFRLPWRSTEGFVKNLLKTAYPLEKIYVPNYAHACRKASKLKLKIRPYIKKEQDGIELSFDSTGINVYSTSGWHQRNYSKDSLFKKRDQWKKVHIGMDLKSMQVLAVELTPSNTNDCEPVPKLCRQIKQKVDSCTADGAYDTNQLHEIIYKWGAKALIPPAVTSKAQSELKKIPKVKKEYLKQRDQIINFIRKYDNFHEGLKEWKIYSGYHKRSLIESFMFRLKKIFGFYFHHRRNDTRRNEIITKINLLNLMGSFNC